jgi:hypothetical protein
MITAASRLSWPVVLFALHRLGDRAFAVLFRLASTLLGRARAVELASRWRPVCVQFDEIELAGDDGARHAALAALDELRVRGYDACLRVDASRDRVYVGTTSSLAFVYVPTPRVDATELASGLRWALAMDGARQTIELVIADHGERGARLLAAALNENVDGIACAVRRGGFASVSARMALRDAWTLLRRTRGDVVASDALGRVVTALQHAPRSAELTRGAA